jgi:hypothetical protein
VNTDYQITKSPNHQIIKLLDGLPLAFRTDGSGWKRHDPGLALGPRDQPGPAARLALVFVKIADR